MFKELQEATLAARTRTGKNLGTSVKGGLFTVEDISYDSNGRSTVKKLTEPLSLEQAVLFLSEVQ